MENKFGLPAFLGFPGLRILTLEAVKLFSTLFEFFGLCWFLWDIVNVYLVFVVSLVKARDGIYFVELGFLFVKF